MRALLRIAVVALLLAEAPAAAQVPDLRPWDGVWFRAKTSQRGYGFRVGAGGARRNRSGGRIYLRLRVDPGLAEGLLADIWIQEGQWRSLTVPLLYLAGTSDDVVVYVNQIPVTPDPVVDPTLHLTLVLRLRGGLEGGSVGKGRVQTVAGAFVEVDDVPGSDERFAGSISVKGKTTTKLPSDLPAG